MGSVQNFFTSRDNNVDPATYVGQLDRLWYNPDTNQIFISDGVTPGGRPLDIPSNATINNLTVSNITGPAGTVQLIGNITISQLLQAASGNITGNLVIGGNISPATETKIGGVRAGPGANISNTGLLTIDTTGLPLSFGNFTANNNILTIVNSDEDMILATQGAAEIQLVGNIGFYKSNGLPPDPNNLFFFARDDGQIQILVPVEDPVEGGVEIIGSATGTFVTPGAPGTMLQLTGNPDIPCRMYHDSLREYSSYVARRYNGTTASPGQVLAGEDVFRINTTAATDAGMGNVAMAQVRFTALEDQTTTAQGSEISFYVTAIGSPAASRINVANISVANGLTATKFVTSGNIDGGNLNLSGNIVADYVVANNVGSTGNVEIESNNTYWYFTTDNRFVGNGNIEAGNISTTGTVEATGNISGGNLITGGVVSATGNITGGNLSGTLITGTLATAAQPNVTSVGTLTSLTVTGNVSGGNINTSAQVVATGNITGANITATANIADSKGDVRSIPINSQNTGYTLQASDAGKVINMTTGNVTVPAGVFATPFGQAITIYNDQNSSNAVVSGAGVTMRLAGTAATGNRTLARYGLATVVCVSANTFVISGAGLT